MEYTYLGRSGLQISRLALGTMNLGDYTSKTESIAIMDNAFGSGINFIDTANRYGNPKGDGITETIIGDWLSENPGKREKIVLATKLHNPMGDGPNDRGLSAYHIKKACEDSLRRLQTDHIDLYQMHHVDRNTPWEEIWQAMEQLVREGKVLYVGSSNFGAWHIVKAQERAMARNFMGLVSEQSLYNLTTRTIELELLPACQEYGIGVLPWSPRGGGVLAGVLKKLDEGRRTEDWINEYVENHRSQLQAYEDLCDELGEHPADVSIAWLLHQSGVTAPIIGPRTVEQLAASVKALEIHLDDEVLTRLDSIFPGPGGEAPEAYAW
ncbi:MAG: aldo/keto reductase [Candidatus Marinimicrobia bacterium]|nr:aldo/keto reductase [Candidatus Neomarinimicrobiota bacterium]